MEISQDSIYYLVGIVPENLSYVFNIHVILLDVQNTGENPNVTAKSLEPVCCKKQQKKVPDQLLVCGIGEL